MYSLMPRLPIKSPKSHQKRRKSLRESMRMNFNSNYLSFGVVIQLSKKNNGRNCKNNSNNILRKQRNVNKSITVGYYPGTMC